jgi:hypothetical protein
MDGIATCSGMKRIIVPLITATAVMASIGCTVRTPAGSGVLRSRQTNSVRVEVRRNELRSINMPRKYAQKPWPTSLTLSPDSSKLAVIAADGSNRWLQVLDTKSGKWIRDFGDADSTAVRWHPTRPVIIAGNDSAEKPAYYMAWLAGGRRKQLFRSDVNPFCWSSVGMLVNDAVVVVNPSNGATGRSGNLGYPIPWAQEKRNGQLLRLACGPSDQVAAEIWSYGSHGRVAAQHVEMYRKAIGRPQWVRVGNIEPGMDRPTVNWYPSNPVFLANGTVAYLRIRPSGQAEVWSSDMDGKQQRKALELPGFHPQTEDWEADWFTIDRKGSNIYYLSGGKIGHIHLSAPIH